MDIAAEDLDPQAGVQYIALDLLERARKVGFIVGSFPQRCLTDKEHDLVRRLLRDKSGLHKYTDLEIAGAIRWAIMSLTADGWQFECDVNAMMRWYRGED